MNIYNRPFDDQSQVRIKLETIAIYGILKMIKEKKYSLLWSFMLEFENNLNPYPEIQMEIEMTSKIASKYIKIGEDILVVAKNFESNGVKPRDAIHLACALKEEADYFLTCDDRLIKKARISNNIILIMNPIDFIRLEEN